jgi:hypothetical protein
MVKGLDRILLHEGMVPRFLECGLPFIRGAGGLRY